MTSDSDIEAFGKYICQHDQGILESAGDTDIDIAERAWQAACLYIKVWKAAVEYKQKEIDELKNVTYWSVEQNGKVTRHISIAEVEKLQTENKQLLTENDILSGEILTYKKMSDDALKKLAEAERFIGTLNNDFDDIAEEEAAEFNELMKDCEELKIENKRLKREVEVLRYYGNKDCTNMADKVLENE